LKNEDYMIIQGWMINELKLKGNDLLIYALIYSYSKDGEHRFYGSLQYLADWTNSTVSGIQNNIKNLLEKNLIFKNKIGNSQSSRCEYWVNLSLQQSCNTLQNSYIPLQQNCNNNKIINNLFISKDINNKNKVEILEKDIYFNNNKTSKSFKTLKTWLELYIEDKELKDALITWLGIMFSNKKIANLEMLKNKVDFLLEELYDNGQRIQAVKDATNRIWFTFQYSVEKIKKNNYNITGTVPENRNNSTLDLSDEVF